MKRFAVALATLLLASCGGGEPSITATDAWAREVAPGQKSAAAYVSIANAGNADDRLVGVRSPVSAEATLHSSSHEGGIMRMRPIDGGLSIAAGSTVKFGPGGNHIMLTRLNRTLRAGDAVELTLDFERSPDQTIAVRILPATATDSHGMAM